MQETIQQELSSWAAKTFAKVFPDVDIRTEVLGVVPTAQEDFGDYQCNAAMSLARVLKCKPRDIAAAFVEGMLPHPAVDRVEIAGPGFLNIFLRDDWVTARIEALTGDERLGVPESGNGQTVVLDYSSPNIAKPMHIGHVRSTVIGNALDRFHRFLGYKVISDNHVGDWGTQFGLLIMGYRNFVDEKALEEAPVEELERVYVESNRRAEADEAWKEAARKELVKLQSGDAENRKVWERFIELSKAAFQHIYDRLGVTFDLYRGESYYNDRLQSLVDELTEKGLAEESEGAQVVKLEEEKLPVCIIRKRDGGFNYATTDLATVESRMQEFKPSAIVYVTDVRQQDHFRQFFTIAKKLGWDVNLVHVWFGLMSLPEGAMAGRKGNVIKLEKLLDEAESRALDIVKSSSPDMSPEQQQEIARAVGIGAVKYADLSQNMQTNITFTWDKALALDGNSAPYLQYACARISSVEDKFHERFPGGDLQARPIQITEPIERKLMIRLLRFPEAVQGATENYRPNYLADYLYDLAQVYSSFYQGVPFLKAEEGIRESRVRLCGLVARVLRKGLDLLGIETPERI